IGSSYITDSKIVVQANLKDVGFIHWYSFSGISNFNATETIQKLSARTREDSIYHAVSRLIGLQNRLQSYSSPTDAKFELSASKSYWLNYDDDFKYIPTLIGSKEILYNGFTAALVNRLQYRKFYNFTLTAAYDNYDLFSLGTQLMYKAPNFEVYLGSERLLETAKLAGSIKNGSAYTNGSYTGANIFLGFSIKFGPVIEHPMNASVIPIGQKGFLGRLWARLFKTYE
ncbi:MAG TPA: DUF5723 family protein, partial [Mucilaginibacter sp.]|nr:DUF5723 family protein [Mucilaginibacter sp.]